jgi:hypothetical protein
MKTIQGNWQHWVHKTQDEDNPGKLATLGTQDTGRKKKKNPKKTNKICVGHHYTQTNTNNINKTYF